MQLGDEVAMTLWKLQLIRIVANHMVKIKSQDQGAFQ